MSSPSIKRRLSSSTSNGHVSASPESEPGLADALKVPSRSTSTAPVATELGPLQTALLARQRTAVLAALPAVPFPEALLDTKRLQQTFLPPSRVLELYFTLLHSHHPRLAPLGRPFVRSSVPSLPFPAYLERLFRYCQPEPLVLLAVIAYSERLRKGHRVFVPPHGWHRWTVAAWLLASKALNGDQFWTNPYWARVAGVSTSEIFALEVQLVRLLDWQLFVSNDEFAATWALCLQLEQGRLPTDPD
jgi:hypothetical protein